MRPPNHTAEKKSKTKKLNEMESLQENLKSEIEKNKKIIPEAEKQGVLLNKGLQEMRTTIEQKKVEHSNLQKEYAKMLKPDFQVKLPMQK